MFNGRSIPKIKFNPEKVSVTAITHDFHNMNNEGKLPLPWFDLETMQKRHVSQKNVFTFSATGATHDLPAEEKEGRDTVLASLTAEKTEDKLVAYKRNETADLPKKRESHRRKMQYDTFVDDIKKEPTIQSAKHPKVSKKAIKIPFSLFAKIHTFRYPPISIEANTNSVYQIEVQDEQDIVFKSESNHEMEDSLEFNLTNDPDKYPKVSKKVIRIPFSLFEKIHNFRYPPILTEANTNFVPQIEAQVEQEIVLKSELNFELEDEVVLDVLEDTQEFNLQNETDQLNKMSKKTIKIPFSLFEKIHNFRYPPISTEANTTCVPQIEDQAEQEIVSPSEPNLEMEEIIASDTIVDDSNKDYQNNYEDDKINQSNKLSGQTETRLRKLTIPFSTFVEIDNFLHPPLFGSTDQKTFTFIDPSDNKPPQLDTKLVDTVTYLHEQPYCHLIGFKSHELIFTTSQKSVERESNNKQKAYHRAVVVSIHNSISMKEGETDKTYPNHKYVYTRVPVIVGEYNVEVCLDEDVLFKEKVYKVKEISKVVELINCKFVPTKYSPSSTGKNRIALKGKLFMEGNIHQSIQYLPRIKVEENSVSLKEEQFSHSIHQNIVIELIIQLLQVQTVINQQLT
ncbi:BC_2427 family protein [Psychrobacillus lasiicapitis]|uniref:DUF7852 domain-containing protein n=1 Tax=Psychrobacillus lasiicapitis TaxID=1636719 RepID=A0A544THK6_9BACI|nr:hypothetical protein [Psychrobacillus lasiicapitis]TQR16924.1 hypothetical protein FG382_01860 [Psychrobacillus lasiicapitis]GGA26025.1 hypothetical protein GCM10011384_14070 [Psychrobacillus lasiicapitis]